MNNEAIAVIAAAVRPKAPAKTVASPPVRNRVLDAGAERGGGPPASFQKPVAAEIAKWRKFAKRAGISAR